LLDVGAYQGQNICLLETDRMHQETIPNIALLSPWSWDGADETLL